HSPATHAAKTSTSHRDCCYCERTVVVEKHLSEKIDLLRTLKFRINWLLILWSESSIAVGSCEHSIRRFYWLQGFKMKPRQSSACTQEALMQSPDRLGPPRSRVCTSFRSRATRRIVRSN